MPGALLDVGRITRAHGLSGDVVVAPISNVAARFAPGSHLHAGERVVEIVRSRVIARGHVVVHLAGVDDRDAAEALRGTALRGEPLGPPPPGELWVHELIGSRCTDASGNDLGTVVAVHDNPAHDLLELEGGALVPMVFVVEHDAAARSVVVDPPDGLLELYR